MAMKKSNSLGAAVKKYLIAGILTIIPLAVTWVIVAFVVRILTTVGGPPVQQLAKAIRPHAPWLAETLTNPVFLSAVAVVLVLLVLLVLGWMATKVIGRQLIGLLDWVMEQVPIIKTIYGATKKLLVTFQTTPDDVQRVVLIDFPSPEMKTVGLVTRTFEDSDTGRKLAAVYVPTTPNPTSGYLEIVPVEKITATDWTVDEAMTFIVSGGAVTPKHMNFDKGAERKAES